MSLILVKSRNKSKSHQQEKLTSIINKKKIRHHLDKVISEFNILPKKLEPLIIAKHVTKTLFWATVYLSFSYLTITSTYKVIQQYRDNQTTTNMKATINNNVSYLPNMTICFEINAKMLLDIHSTSRFNYTSAWFRFFKKTISPEGIFKIDETQIYDDEIYLSLLKYLAMIYEAERAWEPGVSQISAFHSEESDDWVAMNKVLVPHIERYNITLEQLKSVFDGKFCPASAYWGGRCTALLFLYYDPYYKPECVASSKISFIGMDTICFRLVGYKNNLRQLGTTDYINLKSFDDANNQKWCQGFTIDLGSESRSTPRRATTQNETFAYYYTRFPTQVGVNMDIGVKALYRKLPYVKGDLQCSSDSSREECENKCLSGWIRANCHCSPITFNLTADKTAYRNCTVDDYSFCLKKYSENATYLCSNKCVPLCEQWHYEYSLETRTYEYSSSVQMSSRTFDYIIIEQVFTWNSFEEFIGALGGALGIWLGLDFVIITEFIVSLLTKLIKKILLRNAHNSEEDKRRNRADIKKREKNVDNGISSSNEIGSSTVGHQKENKEKVSEIVGRSILQLNANEKRRPLRKEEEIDSLEEEHVKQKRKRSNNNRASNAIVDNKMKNIDIHNERLRNQKVNKIDNDDAVQDEPPAHANYSSARSWLIQKTLFLVLNGDVSTNKSTLFLQLVEKLFWAAIYLVGSVFTTLWCVELVNLYLADEAVYIPSLIINRTISLPPPSLCVSYSNYRQFERHGNIYTHLMEYFDRKNIDRASFIQISDGKNWSEPLVSIGFLYLSILAISETDYHDVNFTHGYNNQLKRAAGSPGHYDSIIKDDIDKSVNDIFVPKLLEWNVTANELRQKLGAELARMAELKITFTNSSGTIDIVNQTSFYTTAVTGGSLCYGLSYAINFNDPDDVLEFSTNRTSYPQLLLGSVNVIVFSDFLLEPERADFSLGQNNVAVYDTAYYFIRYGKLTRVLISVDSLYSSRPAAKGEQYCSPNTTLSYCRAQCRIELIERLCNCSPTYWATMIPPTTNLDECTFDRYMEYLNYNASDDLACRDSCLPFCTANYFRSGFTWDDLSEKYDDTAVFRISVKDGMYTSIIEQPIFTFSDLLITAQLGVSCAIQLGGTLGILLGFNIFSFYQVLAKVASSCFAFIFKRTRFAQSPMLLKSLDKIKKSGISQLISYLNRQLHVMKICTMKRKVNVNEIGKNILLTIGYLSGLYATVRMGNEIVYSYKTGEPISLVDIMMNDTIGLPSWTICMPLDVVELLNETEITQFENNTNLTRNHYFNSFHGKKELFRNYWPTWLIHWAYEYLIIYDTVERHGNQKFISSLLSDDDNCALNESRYIISKYNFTSLMELDTLIDHLNITIPELKQNLGQKIRDIYKTTAVFVKEVDGAWNRTVLNITETTFIGEEKICYRLPLDTVTFGSKSDCISVTVDRKSLPNQQKSSNKKSATIDFSGRDFSNEEANRNLTFGSSLSFWFGLLNFTKLDISSIYEAKPVSSGVRHCSESKSLDTCLNECQQKKIEQVCKCSPGTRMSFPSNSNLTRCHLIDYGRCNSLLVNNQADLCELSCVPHCTRVSFKSTPYWDKHMIEYNVAKINLSLNSFEYLSFKEVYKYTMNDFLSEFGGILGLWIGLDILVFVDLFYWLVCKYCHIFQLLL